MGAGLRSRVWRATARLHPAASSAPIFARRQVLRSFSGAKTNADKADEAAGLSPGNEDSPAVGGSAALRMGRAPCGYNAVSSRFSPEKPCCPLSTDGISVVWICLRGFCRFSHLSFRCPAGSRCAIQPKIGAGKGTELTISHIVGKNNPQMTIRPKSGKSCCHSDIFLSAGRHCEQPIRPSRGHSARQKRPPASRRRLYSRDT